MLYSFIERITEDWPTLVLCSCGELLDTRGCRKNTPAIFILSVSHYHFNNLDTSLLLLICIQVEDLDKVCQCFAAGHKFFSYY